LLLQEHLQERYIVRIDRRAVQEDDDLMRGAAVVVDLPLRGVVLGEGRARAVSDEQQHIPRRRAVAGEVDDDVAVRFTSLEWPAPGLDDRCLG